MQTNLQVRNESLCLSTITSTWDETEICTGNILFGLDISILFFHFIKIIQEIQQTLMVMLNQFVIKYLFLIFKINSI